MMTITGKTLHGIVYVIIAMLFFSLTYAFYKESVLFLPNHLVVLFQSFFSLCLVLPFALRHGPRFFITEHLGLICLRSAFGLAATYCVTLALVTVKLADVTLLNNTAPLFVPFISWIWLKEKIQHKLWPSLILGFVGVLIILQPGATRIDLGLLLALLSGVFSASLLIAARQIAHEPFLRILFYYFLFFCVVLSPTLLTTWKMPPLHAWLYIFLAAVSMIMAQLSFTAAARYASPQKLAPFLYTAVLFSGILDWFVWKATFHPIVVLGVIIVIIGSIITIALNKNEP
jgi:drug/metabolite transporter (DMT)-like permease